MYCKSNNKLYAYHIPTSSWSLILDYPQRDAFAIAIIDGQLTTIGGYGDGLKNTNKLISLRKGGCGRIWTEKFLPMPTKHYTVSTLCTGKALIVAGGADDNQKWKIVLHIDTRQWHTTPDLPEPLAESSLVYSVDIRCIC